MVSKLKRGFGETSMESMRLSATVCNLASLIAVPPDGEEPEPTHEQCDMACAIEAKMRSLIADLEQLKELRSKG